jgi:hypothetical protein
MMKKREISLCFFCDGKVQDDEYHVQVFGAGRTACAVNKKINASFIYKDPNEKAYNIHIDLEEKKDT